MIFAITRRAYPREVLRFSAIARSVMIFAAVAVETAPVSVSFSAIARSVMIFALQMQKGDGANCVSVL